GSRSGTDRASRQGGVGFQIGGVQISIDPTKMSDMFNNFFSRLGGDGGSSGYTDLPSSGGEGLQGSPELERVDVTPGRPAICPAGATEEGFSFNIKFLNKEHADQAYSCAGQTTADHFNTVSAYLKKGGTSTIQDTDLLSK